MIKELSVSGIGALEPTTITFSPGLSVITGETGTGKTMVLRAISLAVGAKGDMNWLAQSDGTAQVDCVFDVSVWPALRSRAVELGAELDGDELIVSRSLGGRSRASVGGRPVPLGALDALFDDVVVIQSQHDQREFARPTRQRALVDRHAGTEHQSLVADISATFDRIRTARQRLNQVLEQIDVEQIRFDQATQLLADLEQVNPQDGEMLSLKDEIAGLTVSISHRAALAAALAALDGDTDTPSALNLLTMAIRELSRCASEHAATAESVQSLTDAHAEMTEVARFIADLLTADEDHGSRLEQLLQRQRELAALTKRHSCADLEDLLQRASQARDLVARGTAAHEVTALESAISEDSQHFESQSLRARHAREESAAQLAHGVNEQLAALGLSHMTFAIRVVPADAHRLGMDSISFELVTADGERSVNLARGASGGEMSRVALAVESVLGATEPVGCIVFDEIDAGVGGVTAHAVGQALARLATHTQVILVTHLPQVAVYAQSHVVLRRVDGTATAENVPQSQRGEEIARMLGERDGLAGARALATEMLHAAQGTIGTEP